MKFFALSLIAALSVSQKVGKKDLEFAETQYAFSLAPGAEYLNGKIADQ